jgi:hypothetical protein
MSHYDDERENRTVNQDAVIKKRYDAYIIRALEAGQVEDSILIYKLIANKEVIKNFAKLIKDI